MVQVDETGKTTFRFRHATDGPVFIAGDFCQWQQDHLPMRRIAPHEWMLMLRLPPGTYEFRYMVAGEWFTDYAAFGINKNMFGQYNSVLRIPKVRPAVHEPVSGRRPKIGRLAASA
jgi:hypothetical protein